MITIHYCNDFIDTLNQDIIIKSFLFENNIFINVHPKKTVVGKVLDIRNIEKLTIIRFVGRFEERRRIAG